MMNNTIKKMMETKGTIYFDMDGTLANFYGVDNWLDYLEMRIPHLTQSQDRFSTFQYLQDCFTSYRKMVTESAL